MGKAIHSFSYNPKNKVTPRVHVNQYSYLKKMPLGGLPDIPGSRGRSTFPVIRPVISRGLSGNILDTQYSRSMLGDYSASWINGAITQILNEQQARLGRFLTYKQKLADLYNRALSIKKVDSTQGTSLVGRVQAAQSNQTTIESQGFTLISTISTIKANPIVKLLTNTDVTQEDLSTDLIARGAEIIASLRGGLSQSASMNTALAGHEKTVLKIESDIVSVEGGLSGRGLLNKASKGITSLLSAPVNLLKYGAIIAAAGVGVFYILPMVSKRK